MAAEAHELGQFIPLHYHFHMLKDGPRMEPFKEAIEKKLITSVRDLSRVITKSRMRDEEQSEKYNAMVKNLLENGYCQSCVDVVLKYAANNLWKD